MDTPAGYRRRLLGFGAALAALFAAGLGAGAIFDPGAPGGDPASAHPVEHGGAMDEHGGEHSGHAAMPAAGVGVAEGGLRLTLLSPEPRRGVAEPLRFRVLDRDGSPLREFDLTHTKRMHLIVVRRDLTGFQHLHPAMAADGTWSAPLRLGAAGSYRVFADFSHDGVDTTLGIDLGVDGAADLRPLPPPRPVARTAGGYEVRLRSGDAAAGAPAELAFAVSRGGHPVDTQPYLGAGGHLVALREGDLAFLHVHPHDGLRFEAHFPTAGRYRLFLQFRVDGRVETAAFTEVVR